MVKIAVMAVPGQQRHSEFSFRFEVTNFPTQAPEVKICDPVSDGPLLLADRPKGPLKNNFTFCVAVSGHTA